MGLFTKTHALLRVNENGSKNQWLAAAAFPGTKKIRYLFVLLVQLYENYITILPFMSSLRLLISLPCPFQLIPAPVLELPKFSHNEKGLSLWRLNPFFVPGSED
jgi:hypothetical protein